MDFTPTKKQGEIINGIVDDLILILQCHNRASQNINNLLSLDDEMPEEIINIFKSILLQLNDMDSIDSTFLNS